MENQNPASVQPQQTKKNTLFGKIETKEEALKIIKDSSNGFYFLSALEIIAGYFVIGISAIIDGIIFAICAFLLRKFNSKVVAIILLLISAMSLITTGVNKFSNGSGGQNIFLAVIVVWISIRAVQATFALEKFE